MANNNRDKILKQLRDADNKTSVGLTGATNELDLNNLSLRDIIRDTTNRASKKFADHTDGKNLDYFTELGLSRLMSDAIVDKKASKEDKKEAKEDPEKFFKKYMADNNLADKTSLILGDLGKYIEYSNYRAIKKHIPECAAALTVYRNNIISPDDFTKSIFTYNYTDSADEAKINNVKKNIEKLIDKYKLEIKTNDIVEETLELGDSYYAVLSLDKELSSMLQDTSLDKTVLQESIQTYDTEMINVPIDGSDVTLTERQANAFKEFLGYYDQDKDGNQVLKEGYEKHNINEDVAKFVNEHFVVSSKLEMLKERAEYEYDQLHRVDNISDATKKNKKKKDKTPLYLNGSAIRALNPERVIDLTIDDYCYGYYYIEENDYINAVDASSAGDYLGMVSGRNQSNTYSMTSQGATVNMDRGNITAIGGNFNKEKLQLVSDVFINTIAKKIDREYIRHNKKFKDFIYSVVKQKYFQSKQIKFTYFTPDEVVHFKTEPVFKNIVFFAKLYLAMLTNYMIINIGRGHDKRLFYVQTGLDDQYEQAVSNVIESIKTKEFRLSDTDINTVLQLNPGALDDYFIPVVNGDRAVEMETMPGMDIDISNNGFLDWLRRSMMNGMNTPSNLIDSMAELDYSRQLAQQNAAFVRNVSRHQLLLQPGFEKFIRKLYENEYKYSDDGDSTESEKTNFEKIEITFPSPNLLIGQTLQEQIQIADSNAEYIATVMVPPKVDGSTEDLKQRVKAFIFKDFVKGVDYDKYDKFIKGDGKMDLAKDKVKASTEKTPDDGMGGNSYGGY